MHVNLATASYLLDLAQRAHELFSNASERLQQKMPKTVLSNIELSDKQLTYIVNDPYRTFIEINKKTLDGSKAKYGATEQNLLKLFDSIIDRGVKTSSLSHVYSPSNQVTEQLVNIIYQYRIIAS